MTNKILLISASIISCLIFSEAQAHFICVSNKTNDIQDVELSDSNGQREVVRLEGRENTCVDVSNEWQEFKASMSVPANNLCQNKQVWPGQWLVIDAKNQKTDCTAQMDRGNDQAKLKDYSHPMYISNKSNTDYTITNEPKQTNCGYMEWLPMTVKAGNTSARLPIRLINTGMCFFEQSNIYGKVGGHLFIVGTSCINCGVGGHFVSASKPGNMKMYRDSDANGVYLDIW